MKYLHSSQYLFGMHETLTLNWGLPWQWQTKIGPFSRWNLMWERKLKITIHIRINCVKKKKLWNHVRGQSEANIIWIIFYLFIFSIDLGYSHQYRSLHESWTKGEQTWNNLSTVKEQKLASELLVIACLWTPGKQLSNLKKFLRVVCSLNV